MKKFFFIRGLRLNRTGNRKNHSILSQYILLYNIRISLRNVMRGASEDMPSNGTPSARKNALLTRTPSHHTWDRGCCRPVNGCVKRTVVDRFRACRLYQWDSGGGNGKRRAWIDNIISSRRPHFRRRAHAHAHIYTSHTYGTRPTHITYAYAAPAAAAVVVVDA